MYLCIFKFQSLYNRIPGPYSAAYTFFVVGSAGHNLERFLACNKSAKIENL